MSLRSTIVARRVVSASLRRHPTTAASVFSAAPSTPLRAVSPADGTRRACSVTQSTTLPPSAQSKSALGATANNEPAESPLASRSTDAIHNLPTHDFVSLLAHELRRRSHDAISTSIVLRVTAARCTELPPLLLAQVLSADWPIRPNDSDSVRNWNASRRQLFKTVGDLDGVQLAKLYIMWGTSPRTSGDDNMFRKLYKLITFHINEIKDFEFIYQLLTVSANHLRQVVPPPEFVALLARRVLALNRRAPITAPKAFQVVLLLQKLRALDVVAMTGLTVRISRATASAFAKARQAELTRVFTAQRLTSADDKSAAGVAPPQPSRTRRLPGSVALTLPRAVTQQTMEEVGLTLAQIRFVLRTAKELDCPIDGRTLRGFTDLLVPLVPRMHPVPLFNEVVPLVYTSRRVDPCFLQTLVNRLTDSAFRQPATASREAKDLFVMAVTLGRQLTRPPNALDRTKGGHRQKPLGGAQRSVDLHQELRKLQRAANSDDEPSSLPRAGGQSALDEETESAVQPTAGGGEIKAVRDKDGGDSDEAAKSIDDDDDTALTDADRVRRIPIEADEEGDATTTTVSSAVVTDAKKSLPPIATSPQASFAALNVSVTRLTLSDLQLGEYCKALERSFVAKLSVLPPRTIMAVLSSAVGIARWNHDAAATARRMTSFVAARLTVLARIGVVSLTHVDRCLELIALQSGLAAQDANCQELKKEYKTIVAEANAALEKQQQQAHGSSTKSAVSSAVSSQMLVPTVEEVYRQRFHGSPRAFFKLIRLNSSFVFGDTPSHDAIKALTAFRQDVLMRTHPVRLLEAVALVDKAFPQSLQPAVRREVSIAFIANMKAVVSQADRLGGGYLYNAVIARIHHDATEKKNDGNDGVASWNSVTQESNHKSSSGQKLISTTTSIGTTVMVRANKHQITSEQEWRQFVAAVAAAALPMVQTSPPVWEAVRRGSMAFGCQDLADLAAAKVSAFSDPVVNLS